MRAMRLPGQRTLLTLGLTIVGAALQSGATAEAATLNSAPAHSVPSEQERALVAASPQGLIRRGVRDDARGLPGPWERELERRHALIKATTGGLEVAEGLLGFVDTLYGEIATPRLIDVLEGVAKNGRHDPLIRAVASHALARLMAFSGDARGSQELLTAAGWVMGWHVTGPFDNAGESGHDAVYAPETEAFGADQTFEGKVPLEPIGWRHRPASDSARGYVSLDELLSPNVHVTGYATTWVRVPSKTKATLHVGTGGAYKIWIDGAYVGGGEEYRTPNSWQDGHNVTLGAGWHRVLVKLGVEEGLWGFFLRVSDRRGAPIRGLESWDKELPPPDLPAAALLPTGQDDDAGGRDNRSNPRTLRALLERESAAPKASAGTLRSLAAVYRWASPFAPEDPSRAEFGRAMDARVKTPLSAWLASFLVQDFNEARALIAEGLRRGDADLSTPAWLRGAMVAELARRDDSLGLDRRAREGFARASELSPDDIEIELARLYRLYGEGFTLASLRWFDDMVARYPDSLMLRRSRADVLADLGRTREVLDIYRELQREYPGDGSIRAAVLDVTVSLGEVEVARGIAEEQARRQPTIPSHWNRLAQYQVGMADYGAAVASMDKALALNPLNAEFHRIRGVILSDLGSRAEGLKALRRSLELRPQQPAVRDLIAVLDPQAEDDLLRRYDVDLEQIVAANRQAPARWEGKEAAVLYRGHATRVLDNGLSEGIDHRIIKVLDDRGVRSQGVQVTSYDPSESYIEVRRARVRRADGRVEELGETRIASMVEAGYRMFYDKRQVQVYFPSLRVGDVVEVVFARRAVARRNIFDDYFGDITVLGSGEPVERLDYALEAPADRKLYFNVPIERTISDDGSRATYRLKREGQTGLKSEASMPGWSEVLDYVHVSTFADWASVGAWYWDLVKGQLVVNEEIREGVKRALATLPKGASRREMVAVIYRHVVRNTRYVGLEFGIHGYKPYRTTEVYDRRFGDCKDKASLLKVMLQEAGIESHLVLVRTRDQGPLPEDLASLAAFNHAIVYVPEFDLYLDGTAEWAGDTELPSGDQGATVLVVKDGAGATFSTIPMSGAEHNEQRRSFDVSLSDDGSAHVRASEEVRGTGAAALRARYEAADQRVARVTQRYSREFPGVEVEDAEFTSVTDILRPVAIRTTMQVPRWADTTPRGLRLVVREASQSMVRALAPQVKRIHPLILGVPGRSVRTVVVHAPRGQRFVSGPDPARVESRFGTMVLRTSFEGATARFEIDVSFHQPRVTADEYPEFRSFLESVDDALNQVFETEVTS